MRVSRRALLGALSAAAVSVGCGYTLAGRGNFLPSYIRIIGVPLFTNTTSVYDLEQLFTQRVRSELLGRGRYEVLPTTDGADAVLTGAITGVSLSPSGFDQNNQATRYTIRVNLRVEFRDMKAGRVTWENGSLEVVDEYDITSGSGTTYDPAQFLGQDRAASDRIADTVARRIVSSILEAF